MRSVLAILHRSESSTVERLPCPIAGLRATVARQPLHVAGPTADYLLDQQQTAQAEANRQAGARRPRRGSDIHGI